MTLVHFTIVGRINNATAIAGRGSVRIREYLIQKFGPGRWRTMKGDAMIRLEDGTTLRAELHWFEAHGVGRVYVKRKRNLGETP
jgi:hypothetical protein